jgi:hypothetical protein
VSAILVVVQSTKWLDVLLGVSERGEERSSEKRPKEKNMKGMCE